MSNRCKPRMGSPAPADGFEAASAGPAARHRSVATTRTEGRPERARQTRRRFIHVARGPFRCAPASGAGQACGVAQHSTLLKARGESRKYSDLSRVFLLAGSALLFCACSSPAGTRSSTSPTSPDVASSAPVTCGAVSDLAAAPASDPEFAGYALARAGPVWFSAFGPVHAGRAALSNFSPGFPTKVLIHPDAGTHPEVFVRGAECATGQPLHFCYGQDACGFAGTPVSESELGSRGDAVVTISADQHTDDIGYMLFPRSGTYIISVNTGSRLLGAVTVQIG